MTIVTVVRVGPLNLSQYSMVRAMQRPGLHDMQMPDAALLHGSNLFPRAPVRN